MPSHRPWREGLQEFFLFIDELKELGHSDDEITSFVKDLELRAFERQSQFMLDGGLTKPEVKNVWRDLGSHGCADEAYSAGD